MSKNTMTGKNAEMNEIFSNEARDLCAEIYDESLIPVFKEYINSFTMESNLDASCIEKYINLGGNLKDTFFATRCGNGDLIHEQFGESAGIYACKNNDNRFLEMLQKYGYEDFDHMLHHATQYDAYEQVEWLLKLPNINVNSRGHRGKTPLYSAVTRRNIDIVKLLLDNGANPNLKFSMCEYTYLDQAIDRYISVIKYSYEPREQLLKEYESIINLLLERGAVTNKKVWPLLEPVKPDPPYKVCRKIVNEIGEVSYEYSYSH